MRYHLRTLLIVSAIGPPVLAGSYFQWKESNDLFTLLLILATCWIFIPILLLWLHSIEPSSKQLQVISPRIRQHLSSRHSTKINR